jgi:hypothetical protein
MALVPLRLAPAAHLAALLSKIGHVPKCRPGHYSPFWISVDFHRDGAGQAKKGGKMHQARRLSDLAVEGLRDAVGSVGCVVVDGRL